MKRAFLFAFLLKLPNHKEMFALFKIETGTKKWQTQAFVFVRTVVILWHGQHQHTRQQHCEAIQCANWIAFTGVWVDQELHTKLQRYTTSSNPIIISIGTECLHDNFDQAGV